MERGCTPGQTSIPPCSPVRQGSQTPANAAPTHTQRVSPVCTGRSNSAKGFPRLELSSTPPPTSGPRRDPPSNKVTPEKSNRAALIPRSQGCGPLHTTCPQLRPQGPTQQHNDTARAHRRLGGSGEGWVHAPLTIPPAPRNWQLCCWPGVQSHLPLSCL
ncbi:hypothetical protein KIL84_021682 [Mauremys mutica]|uniref:Uncharacterized protein n=1 Tax=Mauremys mutica TaxID=74926 RepID=A0A9D3X9D6_9SAUR|nr:hypothetical protein KIL84_021682 [Mauremys mutica]